MAKTKIGRRGFAQVERNHTSGEVEGRIAAMLPVDASMGNYIENGRFAKYDYAKGKVNLTGAGEWMMIYNEEQFYDERFQSHKDFCMKKEDYINGEMVPRLIATELGDIYTTNAFVMTNGKNSKLTGPTTTSDFDVISAFEVEEADATTSTSASQLAVNKTTGYLDLVGGANDSDLDANGPIFEVVKIYTMADGQPGVKIMRIK